MASSLSVIDRSTLLGSERRPFSVALAIPVSIISSVQSADMKSLLVWSIAKAAGLYAVDEIVVYHDTFVDPAAPVSKLKRGLSMDHTYLVRLLQYLETPPGLRRSLFPAHADLRSCGALPRTNLPHHTVAQALVPATGARASQTVWFAEGAVVRESKKANSTRVLVGATGQEVTVNCVIPKGTRVTLQLSLADTPTSSLPSGQLVFADVAKPVAPTKPRALTGLYWGYQVRIANSLQDVWASSPHSSGYELTVALESSWKQGIAAGSGVYKGCVELQSQQDDEGGANDDGDSSSREEENKNGDKAKQASQAKSSRNRKSPVDEEHTSNNAAKRHQNHLVNGDAGVTTAAPSTASSSHQWTPLAAHPADAPVAPGVTARGLPLLLSTSTSTSPALTLRSDVTPQSLLVVVPPAYDPRAVHQMVLAAKARGRTKAKALQESVAVFLNPVANAQVPCGPAELVLPGLAAVQTLMGTQLR